MSHVLAIDIGTSRVKAALIDRKGTLCALESESVSRTDSPDRQSAEAWYGIAASCIKRVMEKGITPDGVALTGNMHALLGIDANGLPVADAELWCSTAAGKESDELARDHGGIILARTGNPVTPVFTLPKVLRMKKNTPEDWKRVRCFLQVKDYIAYRLTGECVTDGTDASGTLLYRLDELHWDEELAQELDIPLDRLPPVLKSTEICGKVSRTAAQETGLTAGTPVVIGCGDLASAALGAGTDRDTVSLTLGTAGQLLAAGERGHYGSLAGKLFAFVHADPALDLYLGSVPGGGFSFEWLAKNTFRCTLDEFFSLADHSAETLPVFLPYLLGRGAPYMDYKPCAKWVGMTAHHTSQDIAAGAVYGVLSALRQSCDILEKSIHPYRSVVLQSLANRETAVRRAANALFRQEAKELPRNPEASLLGAAMLGMIGLGVFSTFGEAQTNMIHRDRLPVPDPAETARAQSYYRRYLASADEI